jgi:predicted PhzF superfamily epimerase YddE/YHI9
VCVTASGSGVYDCVSRGFFPTQGIDEDPVTGSAHAAIGSYWAERFGVSSLRAYQASARGGVLKIDVGETRVTISGRAVTFMTGVINLLDG